MKNLPVGIQSFKKLITGNCIYIDKTQLIYKLITEGYAYFLSRPRRFGKSLLVSTLLEIFKGNKELFEGLWIYDKIDWKQYPVICIDYTQINFKKYGLENALLIKFDEFEKDFNIKLEREDIQGKFIELIEKLSKQEKVAILIDEYDKPIIDYIENLPEAQKNRDILKNLYSGLKSLDEKIKFLFLTGVSKFSQVSIFSDLNHLEDITLDKHFSTILGYTNNEIKIFFKQHLELVSEELKIDKNLITKNMADWYNGYSWDGKKFVYNPFSILNFLKKQEFKNYWFTTGTPTFLIKLIREKQIPSYELIKITVGEDFFDSFRIENLNIYQLLFQTGYLTIEKKYLFIDRNKYVLAFPNREVKLSFLNYLLADMVLSEPGVVDNITDKIFEALYSKDIELLVNVLNNVFATIPYNIFLNDKEKYYQSIIYLVLSIIGISISCEVQTSKGRIDAVIQTDKYIYIVEFKIDNGRKAIEQIKEKKNYEAYLKKSKKVLLLGIGFNKEKKRIDEWKIEEISVSSQ